MHQQEPRARTGRLYYPDEKSRLASAVDKLPAQIHSVGPAVIEAAVIAVFMVYPPIIIF